VKCHGGVKETGGFKSIFRDAALKGGKSVLVRLSFLATDGKRVDRAADYTDEDDRMPKKAGPLRPEQIELLKR